MKLTHLLFISALLAALAGCEDKAPDGQANPSADTKPPGFVEWQSAEEEAVYMARFKARGASQATAIPKYDPMGQVPGVSDWTPLPKATEPTVSQASFAEAEAYLAERKTHAFMVWRGGVMERETYFGDVSVDSLNNGRSLAKPLTAIAVGRAIYEGHITSLDQSAADFITEWQGTDKAKIKIRYLLDMRAGLLPQGQGLEPDHVLNRVYMHPRHEEVLVNEYPLVYEPGSRYDYANATAEMVAVLIEQATGVPYETWVSEQILKPLGARGGEVWMNRVGGTAHSGCCIFFPSETFLRFGILYLQDGIWEGQRLLPEGYVEQVRTPSPQNPHSGMGVYVAGTYLEGRGPLNPDMDLGKVYHSEPYLAGDLFLFDGNSNQSVYIIPSADLVILRTGQWAPKDKGWDNAFLPNTILRGIDFPEGEAPIPQPLPEG